MKKIELYWATEIAAFQGPLGGVIREPNKGRHLMI